ncbi:MAG: helix-hairpin-helix domain-containing protein [Myxococcales bacterium]|nr:helix-hairpin-helix domain-containing protein [Myxococcales bacterium]
MSRPARFVFVLGLLAASAQGAVFEQQIIVEDEDDLFTLEQRGDITSDQLDTLLEVLREGVELNSAGRDQLYDLPGLTYADCDAIIEYRTAKGRIDDPAELVAAGAITGEQLIEIAPFIRIDSTRPLLPVSGKFRSVTRFTTTDNTPPPTLLHARLKGPWDLSAGLMLITTRRIPATPTYDPALDALISTGFGYALHVPRFFAMWNSGHRKVVAGTYTIGFGERVTLDNTRRSTPSGIYLTDDFRRPIENVRTCKLSNPDLPLSGECSAGEKNLYITPDFDWRETFRGVAGSFEDISLGGETTMSVYGFLSYQARSIYQYELYDRRTCEDPHLTSAACKAPPVYIPSNSSRLIYSTLPYLFDELAGGAHVTVRPNYKISLGVTGYGAAPFFHVQPMELDFQEWSRYPNGGAFGAVGVNGHVTVGPVNLYLEGARSFDRAIGGGGGFGVEQRTTFSPKGHELEVSLRYYDDKFHNPFGRPIAAPDELEGLRAKNELGLRLRYFVRLGKNWEFKTRNDFWVAPYGTPAAPAWVPNFYTLTRANFTGWQLFQPSLWVDLRNRNLTSSQRGRCAAGSILYVEGDPYTCNGDLYRIAGRLEFNPHKRVMLATQAWFTWTDDVKYQESFRNDLQLWFEARYTPTDWLNLHLKTRYLDQDLSDPAYLETNLWTYLEATFRLGRYARVGFRYDLFFWLDKRLSTVGLVDVDGTVVGARTPNPENRLMLDVRASF